jgi:hypothetical protein
MKNMSKLGLGEKAPRNEKEVIKITHLHLQLAFSPFDGCE